MTHLLVVDDAVDAAETLALWFDALGHAARVAFDGRQALDAARRSMPEVIFMDLDMPVLDGFGAAQAIRASPHADAPFIVALSGQQGSDVQSRTPASGFDCYLHKPAQARTLMALIDDLARRRRAPGSS